MIKKFKFAFDRTVIGTVFTGFAGQAALIVSGVLVARSLGPHDRGQLALLPAIAVAFSFIVALGLPTAVAFTVATDTQTLLGVFRAIRGWVIAQAAVVFAATALVIAFGFSDSNIRTTALICIPPAAVAWLVIMYGLAVLQGQSRFTAFNILRLLPAIGYAIGAVLVLLIGDGSVTSFAAAWSIANVTAATAVAIAVWGDLRGSATKPVDRNQLFGYGVRAQIGTASPLETFQIDQLVVGLVAGPVALGFYVIGSAFMNLPRFIAQSLGMVAFPRVAGQRRSGGAHEVARQAIYATVLLSGGTVVVLELTMGWLVPLFFGHAYDAAIPVARILALAAFCFSMRRVLGDTLRGVNRPLPATIAEITAWVVYAAIVVPLTLKWDAEGGAAAVAIASAAGLAYIGFSARRTDREVPVGNEPNPEPNPASVG